MHHSNKGSGDGKRAKRGGGRMRGSNVIWGSLDSALYFDGLTGNGENEFTNSVESAVKGAKSAGYFDLTLRITDGMDGTAINAEWQVTRDAAKTPTTRVADNLEVKIAEVVDVLGVQSKPMSIRELQVKIRGGNTILCAATQACEQRGFITHPPGRAHGYVLTELGKKFFAGQAVS